MNTGTKVLRSSESLLMYNIRSAMASTTATLIAARPYLCP